MRSSLLALALLLTACDRLYYVGENTTAVASSGIYAELQVPASVGFSSGSCASSPCDYAYDWIMEHGGRYLLQVGWIASPSVGPRIAVSAWVGGAGGWSAYQEFPQYVLTPGAFYPFQIISVGGDWWQVQVVWDGIWRTLGTYNVPSGATASPQTFFEAHGNSGGQPSVSPFAERNINSRNGAGRWALLGPYDCSHQTDPPYVSSWNGCAEFSVAA